MLLKWEGTYQEYLQTDHWRTMRRLAMEAAEEACILCDLQQDINVHHRTYDRLGNEKLSDLVVLCRACHERVHDRLNVGYPKWNPDDPDAPMPDLLARRRGQRSR